MDEKERLEHIKNNLTIDQVYDLLISLNADPILHTDYIMCRTICHGGNSKKLYYYDNTKLFRCYTECSDTFDIFELIVKVQTLAGYTFALPQALQYIINFFNLPIENENFSKDEERLMDWQIFNRYDKISNKLNSKSQKVEMKIYDDTILKYLPQPRILPWEKEGITADELTERAMKKLLERSDENVRN